MPETTKLPTMNGADVIARHANGIYIRLPRELWVSCGACQCSHCNGAEGFFDTLCVGAKAPKRGEHDGAHTVHMPRVPDAWRTTK